MKIYRIIKEVDGYDYRREVLDEHYLHFSAAQRAWLKLTAHQMEMAKQSESEYEYDEDDGEDEWGVTRYSVDSIDVYQDR